MTRMVPYQCEDWTSIKEKILLLNQPVYVFGQGLQEITGNDKKNRLVENIYYGFKEQEPPGAVNVALIGSKRLHQNQLDNAVTLSPFYIRKSAAEIKMKSGEKRNEGIE